MLTNKDSQDVINFIEYQIRLSFNDSIVQPEDIAYLRALAEGQAGIPQPLNNHIEVMVGSYLQESSQLQILNQRRHVLESDSEIIKLYIRLSILEYLKANHYLKEQSCNKIKKTIENKLVEVGLKNNKQLLEKLKVAYAFLNSNQDDLSNSCFRNDSR